MTALYHNQKHRLGATVRALAAMAILSGVLGLLLLAGISQAMAHENPKIAVKPMPLLWAGEITVFGENFEVADEVTLTLVGPTGELSLGVVTADQEGKFQLRGSLPQEAHPGGYQLRARGKDATAVLDVRIVAGDRTVASTEHAPGLGFHRTGAAQQRVAMAVVLGFLAVGGLALLRAGRQL